MSEVYNWQITPSGAGSNVMSCVCVCVYLVWEVKGGCGYLQMLVWNSDGATHGGLAHPHTLSALCGEVEPLS